MFCLAIAFNLSKKLSEFPLEDVLVVGFGLVMINHFFAEMRRSVSTPAVAGQLHEPQEAVWAVCSGRCVPSSPFVIYAESFQAQRFQ